MPLIDIDGNINDKDLDDNFNFLLGEVNSLKSTVSDLSLNKATKSEIVREIDLVASNIVNDTVGVSGYAVSNALLGLKNRIDNIIASSGTSSTEVVDSRYDSVFDVTYSLLKLRLDAMSQYAKDLYDEVLTPLTTPITVSETITSLTAGALDMKVSNLSWKGLTLVNSVENGDFSDGTVGYFGVSNSISVLNEELVVEITSISSSNRVENTTTPKNITDEWFLYSEIKPKYSGTPIFMRFGNSDTPVFTLNNTNWQECYGKVTPSNLDQLKIYHNTSTNYIVGDIYYHDNVHAINLTALGLTALTESQMLDLVRSGYIDGIQSMYRPKLKTDGKNLFDKNTVAFGFGVSSVDGSLGANATRDVSDFIDIQGGKTYVGSGTYTQVAYAIYDANKEFITGNSTPTKTITTPSNARFLIFSIDNTVALDYDTIQLEEDNGQTLGVYEPYNSSEITADVYLRSLPNGTADEIYESNNKIYESKKISDEFVFDGDEGWANYTSGVGLNSDMSVATINGFGNNNNITLLDDENTSIGYNGNIFDGIDSTIGTSLVGYYIRVLGDGRLAIYTPTTILSTSDLSGFTTYLSNNPVKAIFELEIPETINLTEQGLIDGQLESRENGTVYNTSDTFGSVDVSFDVPTNRAGQIASLIEANSYQQEQIDSKANKVQEDIITPTLINAWTGTPYYYLNEVEEIKLSGLLQSGTGTAFTLPTGYRPSVEKKFKKADTTTGNPTVTIGIDGTVTPSGDCYLDGISFRVGE